MKELRALWTRYFRDLQLFKSKLLLHAWKKCSTYTFSVDSTFSAYKNVKIATKRFYEEEQGPSEKEEYFGFKGLNLDKY